MASVGGAMAALRGRAREIAAAALDILEEDGATALSMRRVGERVGMRAPSIYEHFPSKTALEAALISMGFEEQAAAFDSAIRGVTDPLAALAAAYRDFARRRPNLYRLMTERPLRRELLLPGAETAAAAPLVDAAGGDVDRARAMWAFAHGMVMLELNERFPPDADIDAAWERGLAAFRPIPPHHGRGASPSTHAGVPR